MSDTGSRFHIVFPRGDRAKLCVVEIVPALDYELAEYAVASVENFPLYVEAADFARRLAKAYNLEYVPDPSEPGDMLTLPKKFKNRSSN